MRDSSSAMHAVYFPGLPRVDLSNTPGSAPQTFMRTRRIALPMVAVGPSPGAQHVHSAVDSQIIHNLPADYKHVGSTRRCWRRWRSG